MQHLTEAAFAMKEDVDARFRELARAGLTSGPRKDFALAIKDNPSWVKACLFKVLDGREIEDLTWKQLKPSGDKTPNSAEKEAAVARDVHLPRPAWVRGDHPRPRASIRPRRHRGRL